jgi:hypothetical protein
MEDCVKRLFVLFLFIFALAGCYKWTTTVIENYGVEVPKLDIRYSRDEIIEEAKE